MKLFSALKFAGAAAAVVASLSMPAAAEDWPSQPITLLVPWSAGGGTDPVARLLAEGLSERLGQPVLVDFHPGAAGTVGTNLLLNAKPDGYTIMITSNSPVVNAKYTVPNLPYNVEDVVPITQVTDSAVVMVANTNFPPNDFAELVKYAKENPGKVNVAISGIGGISHLAVSLVQQRADVKFTIVPYKGSGDQLSDLLSGVVDVGVGFPAGFLPGVQSGKLKFIGVMGDNRVGSLPDVPTTVELGYPNIKISAWFMMFGPKGIPQDVVNKIAAATNDFLKTEKAQKRLEELGYIVTADSTPEDAAARLKQDRADVAELFESGAMKLEK